MAETRHNQGSGRYQTLKDDLEKLEIDGLEIIEEVEEGAAGNTCGSCLHELDTEEIQISLENYQSHQAAKDHIAQLIDEKIAKLAEKDSIFEAELIRIQEERQRQKAEFAASKASKKRGTATEVREKEPMKAEEPIVIEAAVKTDEPVESQESSSSQVPSSNQEFSSKVKGLLAGARKKTAETVAAAKQKRDEAAETVREKKREAEELERNTLAMGAELFEALAVDSKIVEPMVLGVSEDRDLAETIAEPKPAEPIEAVKKTAQRIPDAMEEQAADDQVAAILAEVWDVQPETEWGSEETVGASLKLDQAVDRALSAISTAGRKCGRARDWICTASRGVLGKSGITPKLEPVKTAFVKKEAGLEHHAANAVGRIDDQLDRLSNRFGRLTDQVGAGYRRYAQYAEQHKAMILKCFAIGAAGVAAVMLVVGHMTAYEYLYNGKVLGVVKDQDAVYQTIDVIGDKLCAAYNAEIEIDKADDITFRRVIGTNFELDDADDILNSLTYLKDMKVKGYGIYVDGERVAVLDSKDAANGILSTLTNQYLSADTRKEYKEVGFMEDVEIKKIDTKLGKLQDQGSVMQYMLTGAVEKKVHTVEKGQTFSEIASLYNLSMNELLASNEGVDPARLKIGQELVLAQDRPVLTVKTVEVASYNMPIPFGIDYENSTAIYKGEQSVKLQGKNGKRQVVAEIVRSNGQEQSRTELSSQVLSEPINQVVLVGTKAKPTYVASGNYIYPVRGRLSSRFGGRWGRMHNGIDLAVAQGTSVAASNSGTITFAGWNGALGYCVKINHGNGVETWYGHCSKLLVSAGQKVLKGEAIAKAGSTGNSTGPHVHFEVHINGVAKNPLNYL